MELELSRQTIQTAGVLLLTIVAVEWGGWHVLRIVRGTVERTPFQLTFARAGHAHAGVLVTLSLVALLFADAARLDGIVGTLARNGIPLAAILIPAGFFFSSAERGATRPNRAIALVYAGMVALAVGVIALGIGLVTAAV